MDEWLAFKGVNKLCMCLSLADTILLFVCHVSISKYSLERYEFCCCCACLLPLLFPTCPLFENYFGGVNAGELEFIRKVYELECRSRGNLCQWRLLCKVSNADPLLSASLLASCPIWRPLYFFVEVLTVLAIAPPPTSYHCR